MARLVAVKCPNCGANVRVDPERELATCDYCQTTSFVQTKQRRVTEEMREQHPMVIDLSATTRTALIAILAVSVGIPLLASVVAAGVFLVRLTAAPSAPAPLAPAPAGIELDRTRDVRLEGAAIATATTEPPAPSSAAEAPQPDRTTRPKSSAPAEVSRVAAGALTVSGRLDPKLVGDVVRANFGRFRLCHEQALGRVPKLTGTIRARFVIGRDGSISNVSDGGSDISDAALKSCILSGFYGMTFPKPEAGIVTVVYPVILRTEPAKSR